MGNFKKSIQVAIQLIRGRPADLRKFYQPSVARGKTVWPKTAADLLRYGVRWDYDGVIKLSDGKDYHKYQLQPNAGNIPSTLKRWREANGGTHAVIGVMYIEQGKEVDGDDFVAAADAMLDGL
nr:hypothetical protein CFP56_16887 [Quercus suber]